MMISPLLRIQILSNVFLFAMRTFTHYLIYGSVPEPVHNEQKDSKDNAPCERVLFVTELFLKLLTIILVQRNLLVETGCSF